MENRNFEEWNFNEQFEALMLLLAVALKGRKKNVNFKNTVCPLASLLYLRKQNGLNLKDTINVDEKNDYVINHKNHVRSNLDYCFCCDKTVIEEIQNEDFKELLLENLEAFRNVKDTKGWLFLFITTLIRQEFKEGELLALFDRAIKEVYNIKKESSQPHELSLLVSHLVDKKAKKIFDPFGGYLDFATTMPDKHFVAYEIDDLTRNIGMFRLALAGIIDQTESYCIDSCAWLPDWLSEKFDAIITFPSFACQLMMDDRLPEEDLYTDADQAVLARFEQTTNKHGQLIMVVPFSILVSETPVIKGYREYFVKKNWLDSVIVLPSNIFSSTQISSAIIVLKKDRKQNDKIRFVNASECAQIKGTRSILEVEQVVDIIDHPDGERSVEVSPKDVLEQNSLWLVGWYLFIHNIQHEEGYEVISFNNIFELISSPRKTGEPKGYLVTVDSLLRSTPMQYEFRPEDFALSEGYELYSENIIRISKPSILINFASPSFPLYCEASEETPVFVKSLTIGAYAIKDNSIHIGYLCGELYHRIKELNKYISIFSYKKMLGNVLLRVPSYSEQENLYNEAKRAAQDAQLKEWGLQSIIDGYKKQIRERKHQIMQNTLALVSDWGDLKDYLYSNGGKFDEHDTVGTLNPIVIADLMNSLSENIAIIERKINHLTESDIDWGKKDEINIQNFIEDYIKNHQSTSFRFEFEKKKTILKQWFNKRGEVVLQNSEPDWHILIPHHALQQVFDNIVSNAKSHGFLKRDDSNYAIRFNYHYDFDRIVLDISNNGEPLKEGVDTEYVKTYGKSTGTNTASIEEKSHEGLGGDEINTILRKYDADFEVISTPGELFTVTYRISFNNITNNELLLDEDYVFPAEIEK